MGGSSSKHGRREKHFFFGEVVKKKNFNKNVVTVTYPLLDMGELNEWKEKFDKSHDINKDALLIPEGYEYHQIKKSVAQCNCCGVSGETEMTYDDSDFSLHQEIANRRSKRKNYTEEELILLLYSLMQGAKEFQVKEMNVGDIRTKNILITKNSDIKMVNLVSFPAERTSIQKILERLDRSTVFYLAPEEIQYVKNKGFSGKVPNPKTEAWAVGLCVLEAATLENSENIYQMPQRKIDENLLASKLQQVNENYKQLYAFLEPALRINMSQRMSSGECWASMRPYSLQITELKRFRRNPSSENDSIRFFHTKGSGRK